MALLDLARFCMFRRIQYSQMHNKKYLSLERLNKVQNEQGRYFCTLYVREITSF